MRIIEFLRRVYLFPVTLYRKYISPMKSTPSCRFRPTCSEYAIEAVHEWGIIIGTALAAVRIIRCNPFSRGGDDPVPTRAEFLGKMRGFFLRKSEKNNSSPRETSEKQER